MAFDTVNDDPDHHHNQPDEPDGGGQPPRVRKKWITEKLDDPFINHARSINIAAVAMATMATPTSTDDVDAHVAALAVKIGGGTRTALLYCDVGTALARMPHLADIAADGVWPIAYLGKIAAATTAVSDDTLPAVETAILAYLSPRREFQALPGLRKFARELADIVERIEPVSTPPDDDEPTDSTAAEGYAIDTQRPGAHGELVAVLRKDRMAEFEAVASAIYESERAAGRVCTRGDVLMHMCRGTAQVEITMNLYADADSAAAYAGAAGSADTGPTPTDRTHPNTNPGTHPNTSPGAGADSSSNSNTQPNTSPGADSSSATAAAATPMRVWLDGAGWLGPRTSRDWLERCTHRRVSGDCHTPGYVPTAAQKARVRGRDGTCRFPGCDVPAHRCDIDHVVNYDPRSKYVAGHPLLGGAHHPGGGSVAGVTATWNLQCVCRHHHNMKTSRHVHARIDDDGSVTWTGHDGQWEAVTVPAGPLAHIRRQTFGQRATRRTRIIREGNRARMQAKADAVAALAKADADRAIRDHARAMAEYEAGLAAFVAGPGNHPDPSVAADSRAVAGAMDDGWPLTRADIAADDEQAPRPPDPLGPVPGVPF